MDEGPLYVRIADTITQQVAVGALRPGDRVPSLRQVSKQQGVSMSTALQAYLWLETRGYLEARPQSGFFVRAPFSTLIPEPQFEARPSPPTVVSARAVLNEIMAGASDPANVPFGAGGADPDLFPTRRLNQILRRVVRESPLHSMQYVFPPGFEPLRRQIARRASAAGCRYSPDEVTITCGALEAVNLALRAVARPGEVIAVESPTYFGVLESVASLGMRVIEIPTHPQNGMDLDALERAVRKHRVKAVLVLSNCHNPLGYVLSDDYKKSLVDLATQYDLPVIEDDVYGDLTFHGPRPRTAKSYDRKGLVLLCASISKILCPGFRLGWVAAGRYRADVERLKLVTNVSSPPLPQLVIAEFLESGGYDRHLTRLRTTLAGQVDMVRQAVAKYFPDGTRVSRPAGVYMLWIELPARVDAVKLYRAALAEHISVLPGLIFSATGGYKNHIRINCGLRWSPIADRALVTLGRLAR